MMQVTSWKVLLSGLKSSLPYSQHEAIIANEFLVLSSRPERNRLQGSFYIKVTFFRHYIPIVTCKLLF